MESSRLEKKAQVSNEEVNYTDLIENGRKLVNSNDEDDKLLGEHLINLALLTPNIDDSCKIQAMAIKSFLHFKSKDEDTTMLVVYKIINFLNKTQIEKLEGNILFCAVRVIYRGGSLLIGKNKPYVGAFLLYYAKKLFAYRALREEKESYDVIEGAIQNVIKEITEEMKLVKKKFETINEMTTLNIQRLKKLFMKNFDEKSISDSVDMMNIDTNELGQGEKFYIISAVWVKNLVVFLEKFEKYSKSEKFLDHLDRVFYRSNILSLYFSEEQDAEFSNLGIYPCEVNNFPIMSFKDNWIDPSEPHTNIYLKKGLKESENFFYLNQSDWDFVKGKFGCNYEVCRLTAKLSESILIEVNLRNMKLIILNEGLRNHRVDLLKPRNIQISKSSSIADLKEKVKRILKNIIQSEYANVKLYLFPFGMKNHKKETFEMVYSFKNKVENFNIIAEEIDDENLLCEHFKYGPGDLIIAEVDCSFVNLVKEAKQCSLCEKTINESVLCINCSTFKYCSEDCRRKDKNHLDYHLNLNKVYKRKFNISELTEIKLSDLLHRSSKHGLVGLKNLGNTCFMNSALQCLSNCEDLTKYFLTKKVFDEINRNNSHGTGGEVAKAWYELLKELWQGDSNYLCPTNFRQIFVRFVRQFAGFSQQDSHEMLTFMLDALHEDLNRVRQKPYCEMQEKTEVETDLQASSRWWKNHLARENSIIVDLFHGQYKSVITCPQCNRISITYDPFMYLGLPIPAGHYKIKFKFFPYLNEISLKNYIYDFELPVNTNTILKDMKLKVLLSKQGINYDFLEGVILNKDKQLKKIIKDEELILPIFESGNEVVIYEKYPNICKEGKVNDYLSFYIHPSEMTEERNMMFFKKTYLKNISYPTVLTLKKTNTLGDLYYYIYRSYRKVLHLNSSLEVYYKNINNRETLQVEFERDYEREEPFKLHIINNLPEASGFFSSKQSCEFCGNKCENCALLNNYITMKTSVNSLVNKLIIPRPFLISLEIVKMNRSEKLFENLNFSGNNKLVSKQTEIDIYDCMNLFRSEERLEKDNAWYCSKCKEHQEAFKRLEIYKPPNYLIVQFKRFKIKSNSTVMGMLSNRKIEAHIDYPEEGLDLRNYVVGPEKEEAVYDLCGISQHFGGLSSGHYTALCKNFGKWYEFDDDRVSKTSQSDVVNSSAYMLFYRKRSLNI